MAAAGGRWLSDVMGRIIPLMTFRRNLPTKPGPKQRSSAEVRQWITDRLRPDGDCLLWDGSQDLAGYGVHIWNRKRWRVHRLMWTLENGPIPERCIVMHSCDRPECAFIGHLSVGSVADNNRDRAARGRSYRGSRHNPHSARLGKEDGDKFRMEAARLSITRLALRWGISRATAANWRRSLPGRMQ